MSYWIAVAGAFSSIYVYLHVVGGGVEVHVPILEGGLPHELQGFVSVMWHGFTVTMVLCSGLFLIAALRPKLRKVLTLIGVVQYVGFAVLFLLYNWQRFDSLFVMPQWIGFLIIVVIALVGLWRDASLVPQKHQLQASA